MCTTASIYNVVFRQKRDHLLGCKLISFTVVLRDIAYVCALNIESSLLTAGHAHTLQQTKFKMASFIKDVGVYH